MLGGFAGRSDLPDSARWLRRIAPSGEIRRGLVWIAVGMVGILPVILALELGLILLAMAGFPVLEYVVPPSWLAILAEVF